MYTWQDVSVISRMPSFISTQERIAFVYAKQEKNLTLLLLDHRPFFSSGPAQGTTHLIRATESNYVRTRRIVEDGIEISWRILGRWHFKDHTVSLYDRHDRALLLQWWFGNQNSLVSNASKSSEFQTPQVQWNLEVGIKKRFVMVSWENWTYSNVTDNLRGNGKLVQPWGSC